MVNSILPLGSVTGNVSNANFGIEQIPTVAGSGSNTAANPGGTIQVTVPANTFSNTTANEDPTLVTGIRITSFPTNTTTIVINGTVYSAADLAVLTSIVIPTDGNGTPTQTITLDPIGIGSSVISFKAVDAAGKESSATGTATLDITNTPPTTDDKTNAAIASNTATAVDIVNPTGADVDGTVDGFKVTSLPNHGTLYMADGTTAVTLNQVLTPAQADGLKFKPSGTSNAAVTFTIAAIDNDGAEDATPATITIPITNTPPTTTDVINSASISITTTTATDIDNLVGADVDGTVVGFKITSLPSHGTLYMADGTTKVTLNQELTVAEANGLKFTPDNSSNAQVIFTYAAKDNDGLYDATPANFKINIKPVGVNDSESTPLNTAVTTTVTSNDGASATGSTVVKITDPTNGSIVVNVDGTITYTPNNNYTGSDSYTYKLVTPDGIESDPITVTVNVYKAAIAVTKTGTYADTNGDGKVNIGDRINYVFNVTNTGNVTLTNISITDGNAVMSGGPIASLGAGLSDNTTFTAYHVLTQTDIDNGGVFNSAEATAKDPKNNDVKATSTDPTPMSPADPNYPLNPPVPACPTCTITPIVQTGSMSLTKTGTYSDTNGDGNVNVGDRINYVFNVTNTGNVTLTNISITDVNAVMSGGPLASLGAGLSDNTTFTAYHVLTQTDIDNGGVFNSAEATGKDPRNNDVKATSTDPTPMNPADPNYPLNPPVPACPTCTITPLPQTGSMSLTKTGTYADTNGDGKVNVGDRISYVFNVTNTGNVTLTNINITDGNAVISGGPIASLGAGLSDNTTFTAYHVLTQTDIDNGGVFNSAEATGKDPRNNDVKATSTDPTPMNPADPNYPLNPPVPACPTCTITPIPQAGSMSLTKTGTYADTNGDGKVNVGDRINYVFNVTNTGNVTLTNINITDGNAVMVGGPIASLGAGLSDNTTFTAYHVLTQTDIDNGGVFNSAEATAKDPKNNDVKATSTDPTPMNPTDPNYPLNPPVPACPTCTITPLPTESTGAMRLIKTGTYIDKNGDGRMNAGDQINYSFKVENTGNVTLTDIIITDAKVAVTGGPISLAPGAIDQTTFKAVYTITQADVEKGAVYNIATVIGKNPKGKTVTDESESGNDIPGGPEAPPVDPACPTCTITPLPSLGTGAMRLIKTATYVDSNGDGRMNAGDQINYSFKVENTGKVALTNIIITDAKVAVTGGPISLAPGAIDQTTFKAVYTITQADIEKGAVYNIATVTGKDPQGKTVTADSESGNNTPGGPGAPPVDPACPTCTITPLPKPASIALVKKGVFSDTNNDGFVQVGEKIVYTFSVTNTGEVSISNVVINDPKIGVVNLPIIPSVLAPGQVGTVTREYVITKADIDLGKVVNTATAIGKDPNGKEVSDVSGDDINNNNPTENVLPVPEVDVFIPNVITPDGDGKNDYFVIVGAEKFDRIEIEIVNRWGNQVYVSRNYKNNWIGENLNEGTYYYTVKLIKGSKITKLSGWVLLKR